MLASYKAIHGTLPDGVEAELYNRLKPGTYLYNTFGPPGQNKSVCDFVLGFRFTDDITTKGWSKSGDVLRWDADGTIYTQDDLPNHTIGAGAGIITVSTTDGWSGLTSVSIQNSPFTGSIPHFTNAGLTSLTNLDLSWTPVSGDIVNLSGLTSLTTLYLHSTSVSGDIVNLSGLTSLTTLYLHSTSVSGDIANLSGLTSLTVLSLHSTSVSGDIANLSGLTSLTVLSLYSTSVSGDIANLSGLTSLTVLYLHSTSVSGDIANLSGLTSLASLSLYSTSVSDVSGNFVNAGLIILRVQYLGLVEAEVDIILADYVDVAGVDGVNLDLSKDYVINLGGNNAPPSAQGLADKATLEGFDWAGNGGSITITVSS